MLAALAGIAIIVLTLREVLHELFQPGGSSSVSRLISRAMWWSFRRIGRVRPQWLPLAGPAIVAGVLTAWAWLLIVGWALVYWPSMPEAFDFSGSPEAAAASRWVTSLYLSTITFSTLGFGDITPITSLQRFVTGAEGLVGFGFLTAGISWILTITPVLSRRRSFAHYLHLLEPRLVGSTDGVPLVVLLSLGEHIATLRTDLINTPVAYYFHRRSSSDSLAVHLPTLYAIAGRSATAGATPEVRACAATLRAAIESYAEVLAERFIRVDESSTDAILVAYAADHGRRQ